MHNLLRKIQKVTVLKLFLLIAHLAVVIIVIVMLYDIETSDISKDNEFSCHYLKDEGALTAVDDITTFRPNAIFFIESSCQGLTSRQACSVESAAKANPDRQVILLFTSPMSWNTFKSSGLSLLIAMPNVETARIHIAEYSKNTPFYNILSKKHLNRYKLNINIGDILKYLTVYKYSGTYLGLDVLVARSFDDLKDNWIVKESPASISSDMFSFSDNKNGRLLAATILNVVLADEFLENRPDLWTLDNVNPMHQLVNAWCKTSDILELRTPMCEDLQVYEPDAFIPISLYERQKYFEQGGLKLLQNDTIYTFQTFGYLTKHKIFPRNSLYDELARKYCPEIFHFHGVHFGLL